MLGVNDHEWLLDNMVNAILKNKVNPNSNITHSGVGIDCYDFMLNLLAIKSEMGLLIIELNTTACYVTYWFDNFGNIMYI